MTTPICREGTPSERTTILNLLRGQELDNLVRYSWLPENQATEEYGIKKDQVFSLTTGPLLMYFNSGLVVGCASQPSKNSVTLWVETNENGETIDDSCEEDGELFPIHANKQHLYWNNFLGKKIISLQIIQEKPKNAKYARLQNEVGLILTFEDKSKFVLSHGLHDNSDDFSVIREEQIAEELLDQLYTREVR